MSIFIFFLPKTEIFDMFLPYVLYQIYIHSCIFGRKAQEATILHLTVNVALFPIQHEIILYPCNKGKKIQRY